MHNTKTRGFSLLEVLLSLSIGIFMVCAILKIYSVQEKMHAHIQDLTYLDHNALIALNVLNNEIQTAGYIGCLKYHPDLGLSLTPFKISPGFIQIEKMDTGILPIHTGDEVIVSNCETVTKEKYIKNISGKQIGRYIQESFYVKNQGLFLKRLGDNAVEIISGVKNFKVIKMGNEINITLTLEAHDGMSAEYSKIITLQEF